MFEIILGAVALAAAVWMGMQYIQLEQASHEVFILRKENAELTTAFTQLTADHNKLYGQKKSSEVRLGQISEQLAPFLNGFPYNPKECHFIGMPVDYVVFGEKGITFVEIKSGGAQLTTAQKAIRDHIKEGRVKWDEFRIAGTRVNVDYVFKDGADAKIAISEDRSPIAQS